ncbi:MAG: tyrosine-type recombinase/integrase [Methanofollis sp.]|uniref:site-specific tyrosine recombinase/integron integrase n=1 Tax=Methanofollis sp. TaxID=2052835 RepID=UPI00262ECAA5|nr:site-specific tyrosine recombinase/integron integrase [Methanofollis sp.]MDD4255478.1 tyrosine-type recombinase/integrase [Methanofollis sp.]
MADGDFSERIDAFMDYLRMRNYSKNTLDGYARVLKKFSHYVWLRRRGDCGDADALRTAWLSSEAPHLDTGVEVSRAMVTDFLSFLTSVQAYKPTSIRQFVSALSSFYLYLFTQEAVTVNPMPGMARPRIKEQEMKYLKHNQVMRLLKSIEKPRDRLIIRLIYATGVRVSELCAIDVGDIDFDEGTIRILGKGGKIRTVFVDEGTLAEVEDYIGNKIVGPLFVGQNGHHITPRTVQYIFEECAPPGITPHKIRHSYASELYRRSKNLRVVQENLGHASIKTTEIYLHTDLDERQAVYRQYFPLSHDGGRD